MGIGKFTQFIGDFQNCPADDRYVLSNTIGDGRVLTRAPSLVKDGATYVVSCPVQRSFPRIKGTDLPADWATDDNDNPLVWKGDIALVAGIEFSSQKIRNCLSVQKGEMWFHPEFGVRISEYYEAYHPTPWFGRLLKLEVIRQAAIPQWDDVLKKAYTPLLCVNRVSGVEALKESPVERRLPIRFDLEVEGVGSWTGEIAIFVPTRSEVRNPAALLGPPR